MIPGIFAGFPVASGPPPGGFPQVASAIPTLDASQQTDHNVSMPATVNAGDLLVAMMTFGTNTDPTITTPSGWTSLAQVNDGGFNRKSAVFYKVAVGTEDGTTVNFVTSNNQGINSYVVRITGAAASGMIEQTNALISNTFTAAPADLTPSWGSAETLWIVFAANRRGNPVNTYPFPDNNYDETETGGIGTVAFCSTEVEASSIDPANIVFTNVTGHGGEFGVIFTIGIKPA